MRYVRFYYFLLTLYFAKLQDHHLWHGTFIKAVEFHPKTNANQTAKEFASPARPSVQHQRKTGPIKVAGTKQRLQKCCWDCAVVFISRGVMNTNIYFARCYCSANNRRARGGKKRGEGLVWNKDTSQVLFCVHARLYSNEQTPRAFALTHIILSANQSICFNFLLLWRSRALFSLV